MDLGNINASMGSFRSDADEGSDYEDSGDDNRSQGS